MAQITSRSKMKTEARTLALKPTGCAAAWQHMRGNDRLRWSERCQHFVYNPAILTNEELLSLIWFQEGVRPDQLFRRKDGKILSRQCGAGNQTAKLLFGAFAVAGLVTVPLALLSGASNAPLAPEPQKAVADTKADRSQISRSQSHNAIAATVSTGHSTSTLQQPFYMVTSGVTVSADKSGANPLSYQLGQTNPMTPQAVPQQTPAVGAQPASLATPVQAAAQAPLPLDSNQPGSQTSTQPGSAAIVGPVADDAPSRAPAPSYVWDARLAGRKTQ